MCAVLDVSAVAGVMNDVGVWWAVAGGWAIDLWLGEQTREHHDIEVAIRRADQRTMRQALDKTWELYCLDPPGSDWRRRSGGRIEQPAFQLQARSALGEFDVFLETVDDSEWQYRRDSRVRRPLLDVTTMTPSGPVVRPEVQLLYMATSDELKNADEFSHAAPRLDVDTRAWLKRHLTIAHPDHAWLGVL